MVAEAERLGLAIMAGCMVATSLAMAPAMLLAQRARYVDLDGPLLLAKDRPDGLRYAESLVYPPTSGAVGLSRGPASRAHEHARGSTTFALLPAPASGLHLGTHFARRGARRSGDWADANSGDCCRGRDAAVASPHRRRRRCASPKTAAARSDHYLQTFACWRSSGEHVVIDGNCLSACTLVLGLIPRERICATAARALRLPRRLDARPGRPPGHQPHGHAGAVEYLSEFGAALDHPARRIVAPHDLHAGPRAIRLRAELRAHRRAPDDALSAPLPRAIR